MSESKNDEDADGGETEVYNFKLKIDRLICHQQCLTSSFCHQEYMTSSFCHQQCLASSFCHQHCLTSSFCHQWCLTSSFCQKWWGQSNNGRIVTLFELESAATRRLGKFIAFVHLLFATHQSIAQKVFLNYAFSHLFISSLPLNHSIKALHKKYFLIMLPHIQHNISFDGAVVSLFFST